MQSLARVAVRESDGGQPLPAIFPSFDKNKVLFRRASVHIIAGAPGSGKTFLTLTAVAKLKLPTLYFSTDSDAFTVSSRLLALEMGKTTDEAERALTEKPGFAASLLKKYDYIRFDFHPSPELDDIWNQSYAFHEMYGDWPQVMVIDIASDVAHVDGDEFATLRSLLRECKRYARDTGAAVIVVHHTSEAVPGYPCQPRSALFGKIAQLPVLILTTAVGGGYFYVACVKNRYAKSQADGKTYLTFKADLDRCLISEDPNPQKYQKIPEPVRQNNYTEDPWKSNEGESWWEK